MAAIAEASIPFTELTELVHGSTVATNAILERKGARVAFFVTGGFRDLLSLQRHDRTQIYDLFYDKPSPVVMRQDTFEIAERIDASGAVSLALDEAEADAVVERALGTAPYEAVAILFLNSYANPDHERRLAEIIRTRYPEVVVTCSSDVTREFREYERASTCTLAAYVQPVIDRYLSAFERQLAEQGFDGHFSIMQSNGGRLPAAGMRRNAITSLFSGPAAGVIGAVHQAARSGLSNIITLDMGGTSTDVCLVREGRPDLASETEINGLPVRTPVIDIETIGAGGGSIVWLDDGGFLRVGPESTGADPGPACYGRGGEQASVTDAHLLRGTLRADAFLGGRMTIDADASRSVFEPLADALDLGIEAAADAALRVADANIVRAIQLVSTERGRDPRDYALVPFGGAGPLHAVRVAEQLGINTVLVPPNAGVLSAFGLLAAHHQLFETRTVKVRVDALAPERIASVFESMRAAVVDAFNELGLEQDIELGYWLEMRFVGQAFEIPVTLDGESLGSITVEALLERFEQAHREMFAFGDASRDPVEIVSFRVGASALPGEVPALVSADGDEERVQCSEIYENGSRKACTVLSRAALARDGCVGPALIEDDTSTIFVPEGWHGMIDSQDNLVLRTGAGSDAQSEEGS
jgi:N-methylhydantoinase A